MAMLGMPLCDNDPRCSKLWDKAHKDQFTHSCPTRTCSLSGDSQHQTWFLHVCQDEEKCTDMSPLHRAVWHNPNTLQPAPSPVKQPDPPASVPKRINEPPKSDPQSLKKPDPPQNPQSPRQRPSDPQLSPLKKSDPQPPVTKTIEPSKTEPTKRPAPIPNRDYSNDGWEKVENDKLSPRKQESPLEQSYYDDGWVRITEDERDYYPSRYPSYPGGGYPPSPYPPSGYPRYPSYPPSPYSPPGYYDRPPQYEPRSPQQSSEGYRGPPDYRDQ